MQNPHETRSETTTTNRPPWLIALTVAAVAVFTACDIRSPDGAPSSPKSAIPNPATPSATAASSASSSADPTGLTASLARLEILQANEAFDRGDTATALAHLARTIRRDPDNRIATRRLLFALTHRSFALPSTSPMQHDGIVNSSRYSPDGSRIVTASDDGAVRVWNAADSAFMVPPIQLASPVLWAEFDSTGNRIVAGSRDGSGWLLDAADSTPPKRLLLSEQPIFHVEFNPLGTRALTAARDDTIALWDAETGEPVAKLAEHQASLQFARYSPDGKRILSGDAEGIAYLWDAETGEVDIGPMSFPGSVIDGRFSPDGASLALALSDGTVRLLETLTGLLLCAPIQHGSPVAALAYSPDGLTLATATRGDGRIQLFDTEDGSLVSGPVTALASAKYLTFSPDGLRLASATGSGAIQIWDGLELLPLSEPIMGNTLPKRIQFSPDGARLLASSADSTAQVWDIRLAGSLTREFQHDDAIEAAAFDTTGDQLATAAVDGQLRLWEFSSGREIWSAQPHESAIVSIHFSNDDSQLVTASQDGNIARLDVKTGEPAAPPVSVGKPIERIVFGPNEKWIATQSTNGAVTVWNAESGEMKPALLEIEGEAFFHARFSPAGNAFATASETQVQFWTIPGGEPSGAPVDFQDLIQAIEYAGGGARILVGLDDGSLRLHDTATGEQVVPIMRHDEYIWSINASRDGQIAASSSDDGAARIWDTVTGLPLTESLDHETTPWSLEFNSRQTQLFTGTLGGRARAWDVSSGLPLTPPLPHDAPVSVILFHPKGNVAVAGGGSPVLRVWPLPEIDAPAPQWLPDLAEALGGQRLNDRHILEPVSVEALSELQTRLHSDDSMKASPWGEFASWFFGDPLDRPVRPGARQTAREEISSWLNLNDLPRFRHMALRSPADSRIWNRIAEMLAAPAPEAEQAVQIANARIAAFCRLRARQLGGNESNAPVPAGISPNPPAGSATSSAPTEPSPDTSPRATPDSGAALYFDGATSRIVASNVPFDEYDTFTIEAWVQQWESHILSQGVFDTEENGIWLTLGAAGSENSRWSCGWRSGVGKEWAHPISADHRSAWQHLALSFDGRRLSIYLNGRLRHSSEAPTPGPLAKNRSLLIGAHEWTDRLTFGTGFMRNLRVSRSLRYREDFTPDPVLRADRQTVLLYDFSIDPGQRAIDRSGNERHGTVRGAIWSAGQ